jgi:predicted acylesterase/phospholipase RssA
MLTSQKLISLENYKHNRQAFSGTEDSKLDPKANPDPLNRQKVNLDTIDTIGWVFSGGGAKGVFEAGVACALAKAGLLPDVLVGTSVGALNAAALADGDVDKAVEVWKDISKDKVYKTRIGKIIFESLGQIANWIGINNSKKVKSLLDNSPLRELLKKHLDYDSILDPDKKHPALMFGVTGLNNGREGLYASPELYEALKDKYDKGDFYKLFKLTPDNFEDAVISSTSIPMAFPAVQIDDEVFVDGGTGNNTPAKNGIDALFALNKDLKEGLLFVVLLQPPDGADQQKDHFTAENADVKKVAVRTLNIILDNTAKTDVKTTQAITEEIERWEKVNSPVQDALEKIGMKAQDLKMQAAEMLKLANLLPKQSDQEKLRRIAEELSDIGEDNIEDAQHLSNIIGKYKPFDGKKKIKVVLIRPNESFGVDTLEFDKAGQKAEEVIRKGYEATLNALYQTEVINLDKYRTLMQENPYPVGNMFDRKSKNKETTASKLAG